MTQYENNAIDLSNMYHEMLRDEENKYLSKVRDINTPDEDVILAGYDYTAKSFIVSQLDYLLDNQFFEDKDVADKYIDWLTHQSLNNIAEFFVEQRYLDRCADVVEDFIAYNTKITAIFPIHPASIVDIGNYYFNGFKDPTGFTSSILVRQDIDFFDTYKVALAIYKNIGNANARIGLFGNPIGIDIWDNSVYTTGASLNASVAPDALSVLLFTEARWDNLAKWVKSLSVGIDGRYTTAPSADEYSLKLLVDWGITDTIKLGVIINYYTHFMYSSAWDNEGVVSGNHILDRSYLMTNIAYNF